MEAKFIAFSIATQEALWFEHFLDHLGVNANIANLISVNCNNHVVIAYTKDPKYHYKIQHIDTKDNFVKNMIACKEMNTKYISMHEMVINSLIKPISWDIFIKTCEILRIAQKMIYLLQYFPKTFIVY